MYNINVMSKEEALEIVSWKYDGIYNFYSHVGTIDEIERLLQGCYYSARNNIGQIIGYYCFGKPAQVPNGIQYGAYDDCNYLDMGIGMKPELTGQGLGYQFISSGIDFAKKQLSATNIRLTVATFNLRAIKVYEKIGFKPGILFERKRSNGDIIQFMTMYLNSI